MHDFAMIGSCKVDLKFCIVDICLPVFLSVCLFVGMSVCLSESMCKHVFVGLPNSTHLTV